VCQKTIKKNKNKLLASGISEKMNHDIILLVIFYFTIVFLGEAGNEGISFSIADVGTFLWVPGVCMYVLELVLGFF
jgi:hypothetical protein